MMFARSIAACAFRIEADAWSAEDFHCSIVARADNGTLLVLEP